MLDYIYDNFVLMVFDWRLGLFSLIPAGLAFVCMGTMMGENMKKKMEEYQNALEEMSSEAVEYVRGIPVVKTFGQSVFSFKRFQQSIQNYEKWTISYTKDLRIPMTFFEGLSPTLIQGYLFAKPCKKEAFERAFIGSRTSDYKEHEQFVQKIYQYKDRMHLIYFNPKDILRENDLGLRIIRNWVRSWSGAAASGWRTPMA